MSQITCQRKDKTLRHSIKHPSKRKRHTDIVLLQRELYLNLNRHIRHGRVLKNIGLWSRVHKIPTSVRRKAECPGKHWSLKKRIGSRNPCFEHTGFRISATFWIVLHQCALLWTSDRLAVHSYGTRTARLTLPIYWRRWYNQTENSISLNENQVYLRRCWLLIALCTNFTGLV